MIWFRSRIRSCSRLALFALALQIAVSFGHMHPDDLGLPPHSQSTQMAIIAAARAATFETRPATLHISAKMLSKDAGDADRHPASNDYCPICADMALVATAIPSLPPVLIVLASVRRIEHGQLPADVASRQAIQLFQARAPPQV
jgi:hypothetical protein